MSKGKMGFWTIVLFGINSIIGSGIFLLPNNAKRHEHYRPGKPWRTFV